MYIVTVVFVVADQHRTLFAKSLRRQAAMSLATEPKCHRFDVSVDVDNGSRFFLYEQYDDEPAFEQHLASEHFKEFDSTVRPWAIEKTVKTWRILEDAT